MFYTNSEEEIEDTITYFKLLMIIIIFICIGKIENKNNEIKKYGMLPRIRNNLNEEINDINSENNYSIYHNNYIYNHDMTNNNNKITKEEIEDKKEKEIQEYEIFSNLKNIDINPHDKNDTLIQKEKQYILKKFSDNMGAIIKSNMTIIMDTNCSFGNRILIFNKLIFYCEIIGCKKIILEKNNNLYIRNNIYDKKYDLVIEVSDKESLRNLNDIDDDNGNDNDNDNFNNKGKDDFDDNDDDKNDYNYDNFYNNYMNNIYYLSHIDDYLYFNNYNIRTENRFHIFKDEILRNLPIIKTNPSDLYIHIRGGDIFLNRRPGYAPDYGQPPLCFYQKIINSYNFREIYIISGGEENPVLKKLINENKNKNITYKANTLEKDIASLAYAHNVVGSISSFLISIIKLNDNLKYLWEYDRYPVALGVPHLHHSLYNFTRKYTIFKMKPSKMYQNQMILWQGTDEQMQIMLNDSCPYDFTIIKPNI